MGFSVSSSHRSTASCAGVRISFTSGMVVRLFRPRAFDFELLKARMRAGNLFVTEV
jgi:hypothetical protein